LLMVFSVLCFLHDFLWNGLVMTVLNLFRVACTWWLLMQFRDNINWQFISDQMESRTHSNCLTTWYNKVASSMVSSGHWAITDDSLLLQR
jgi:hypothetical protein